MNLTAEQVAQLLAAAGQTPATGGTRRGFRNLNRLSVEGFIGQDAVVRDTKTGLRVMNVNVANHPTSKEGQPALWIKARGWGRKDNPKNYADSSAPHLVKGRRIYVEGRVRGAEGYFSKKGENGQASPYDRIKAMLLAFKANDPRLNDIDAVISFIQSLITTQIVMDIDDWRAMDDKRPTASADSTTQPAAQSNDLASLVAQLTGNQGTAEVAAPQTQTAGQDIPF